MNKKETSPVRGGIKFKHVNNISLLRSFRVLSNLYYKHDAPTERKRTIYDFQTASIIAFGPFLFSKFTTLSQATSSVPASYVGAAAVVSTPVSMPVSTAS